VKVCCISDLHGHFPEVPDCDLLLLGGDYAPACRHNPRRFYYDCLQPWLRDIRGRGIEIVGVAGNHDELFEKRPLHVPNISWHYLLDSGVELFGLKIWGSPWQPRFMDWAFNLDEPELSEKWQLIPDGTDILLLHGPPYYHCDYALFGQEHTGSPSLLARIEQVQPKLVVCGHIHEGYGMDCIGKTLVINASHVDVHYRPVNPPVLIEL
jgi:Icc-related predicted phosphoesterase